MTLYLSFFGACFMNEAMLFVELIYFLLRTCLLSTSFSETETTKNNYEQYILVLTFLNFNEVKLIYSILKTSQRHHNCGIAKSDVKKTSTCNQTKKYLIVKMSRNVVTKIENVTTWSRPNFHVEKKSSSANWVIYSSYNIDKYFYLNYLRGFRQLYN